MDDGRAVVPRKQSAAMDTVREIESGRQAARTLERIHRRLGDLPADGQRMNAIAAVLMYSAVGLEDADIATALGTSEESIAQLKKLDAYTQLAEMFDRTAFDDAKRTANHIIAGASARAAEGLTAMVDDNDPLIALSASKEVLRLADIGTAESANKRIGGLNIVIRRKGDRSDEEIHITAG